MPPKKRGESRTTQGKLNIKTMTAPAPRPPQFTHNRPEDDPDFPLAWRASRCCYSLLHLANLGRLYMDPDEIGPPYRTVKCILEVDSDLATPMKDDVDAYIAARKELMV